MHFIENLGQDFFYSSHVLGNVDGYGPVRGNVQVHTVKDDRILWVPDLSRLVLKYFHFRLFRIQKSTISID